MIIAPKTKPALLLVHIPKTGGTSWAAALRKTPGAFEAEKQHTAASQIPQELRAGRHVFAVVRDPVSWYMSLFAHCVRYKRHHEALRAWGRGSMAIEDVLPRWLEFDCPDEQLHAPGIIWEDEIGQEPMEEESLWSWTMRYFLLDDDGNFAVDEIVDYANMNRKAGEWGLSLPFKNQGRNVYGLPANLLQDVVDRDRALESALMGDLEAM